MGNHIHLLLREGNEEFSNTMRRIGASYVNWYNWQYNRKGHLFQDRFRSEAIENDGYFLTVLRYIHQNPVKAGLTENLESYKWSSFNEYVENERIVNKKFVLEMFNKDSDKALEAFVKFNRENENTICLEEKEIKKTISDKEIRQLVKGHFDMELISLSNRSLEIQKEILKYLKDKGASIRQISRLTGFTVNKVHKA